MISVVIPCFNQGQYIDEAVDSVLAQTFTDWEIVIVNDGSTDDATNERLRDYDRPKTRVITTPNKGLGAARNVGINASGGGYICALDADDALVPTYFEKAVGVLDANPALSFASCWLETFGQESWTWKPEHCDFPTLLDECTVCTAALVRTPAARTIGGYDEAMPVQGYEDWDFWIGLVERGLQGTIIPEVLFRYRRRPQSMSVVCGSPDMHARLMTYMMSKHQASYDRHLQDLLLRKEIATARVLKAIYELERQLDSSLLPAIARRQDELHRLRHRAEDTVQPTPHTAPDATDARIGLLERAIREDRARLSELSTALAHAIGDAAALRGSVSWRLTAPLRAMYDLLLKLTRGSSAGDA